MLGAKLTAGAGRHADSQRHTKLFTRHVTDGCGTVEDLVKGERAEIHRHHFNDGTHAGHSRANIPAPVKPDSDSGVSRMRSGAEFGQEPLGHRIAATVPADILAH
jgi:hypothetical protein